MTSSWFSHPLAEWRRSVDAVQWGVRTLPEPQLVQEMHMLRQISLGAPDDLASRLLFRVYEAEQARRADPLLQFDAELDAALERLERQTTAEDRQRVTDIGLALHRLGGVEALRACAKRMMKVGNARIGRASVLDKRWGNIAPWRDAA